MSATGTITMSMYEIDRLKIIQAVVDGNLKPIRAAERLQISTRQVRRLVNRYRAEGTIGLASKKRGQRSNRQLAPGLSSKVHTIIRDRYVDFGPTLACEKLHPSTEIHQITRIDNLSLFLSIHINSQPGWF